MVSREETAEGRTRSHSSWSVLLLGHVRRPRTRPHYRIGGISLQSRQNMDYETDYPESPRIWSLSRSWGQCFQLLCPSRFEGGGCHDVHSFGTNYWITTSISLRIRNQHRNCGVSEYGRSVPSGVGRGAEVWTKVVTEESGSLYTYWECRNRIFGKGFIGMFNVTRDTNGDVI